MRGMEAPGTRAQAAATVGSIRPVWSLLFPAQVVLGSAMKAVEIRPWTLHFREQLVVS